MIWYDYLFFSKKKRKLFNDDPLYCVFGHPFIYIVTFVSHTCMNNKNTITIINLKTRIQIHWFCWWWYSKEKEREKKTFTNSWMNWSSSSWSFIILCWWWFDDDFHSCVSSVCVCVCSKTTSFSLFFFL